MYEKIVKLHRSQIYNTMLKQITISKIVVLGKINANCIFCKIFMCMKNHEQ